MVSAPRRAACWISVASSSTSASKHARIADENVTGLKHGFESRWGHRITTRICGALAPSPRSARAEMVPLVPREPQCRRSSMNEMLGDDAQGGAHGSEVVSRIRRGAFRWKSQPTILRVSPGTAD